MRASASDKAEMVNQILFGDTVEILEHQLAWSLVRCTYDNYEGWIDNKQYKILTDEESAYVNSWNVVVGVSHCIINVSSLYINGTQRASAPMAIPMGSRLPEENSCTVAGINIKHKYELSHESSTALKAVAGFLNAPYLWGGKTWMGVDCSGLTQTVFKVQGISLPRNASQQALCGKTVPSIEVSEPGDLLFFSNPEGQIVHVGIKFTDAAIIHSSGRVRIDSVDEKGIFNHEEKCYTHHLCAIRRII